MKVAVVILENLNCPRLPATNTPHRLNADASPLSSSSVPHMWSQHFNTAEFPPARVCEQWLIPGHLRGVSVLLTIRRTPQCTEVNHSLNAAHTRSWVSARQRCHTLRVKECLSISEPCNSANTTGCVCNSWSTAEKENISAFLGITFMVTLQLPHEHRNDISSWKSTVCRCRPPLLHRPDEALDEKNLQHNHQDPILLLDCTQSN